MPEENINFISANDSGFAFAPANSLIKEINQEIAEERIIASKQKKREKTVLWTLALTLAGVFLIFMIYLRCAFTFGLKPFEKLPVVQVSDIHQEEILDLPSEDKAEEDSVVVFDVVDADDTADGKEPDIKAEAEPSLVSNEMPGIIIAQAKPIAAEESGGQLFPSVFKTEYLSYSVKIDKNIKISVLAPLSDGIYCKVVAGDGAVKLFPRVTDNDMYIICRGIAAGSCSVEVMDKDNPDKLYTFTVNVS